MRRSYLGGEYYPPELPVPTKPPPPAPSIAPIVDAPLNGNGLDMSGNGNHLTAGSAVQWATIDGRQVLYALNDSSYLFWPRATQPNLPALWNNFRLEIDFCIPTGDRSDYFSNVVDNSGSEYDFQMGRSGLVAQLDNLSGLWVFGIGNPGDISNHFVFPSTLLRDKWYKLIMQKIDTDVYAGFYDDDNDVVVSGKTLVVAAVVIPPYNFTVGKSAVRPDRYLDGYLRNLKIWDLS